MLTTIETLPVSYPASRQLGASCHVPPRLRRGPSAPPLLNGLAFVRKPAPRLGVTVQAALMLPPGLGRAIATPILATGHLLLGNANIAVGVSATLGAGAMELARTQDKFVRIACACLAVASPLAMHCALGALMGLWGIDAAQVPMQAVLDTALAAIAGTSLALVSSLMRPPWCSDAAPAAIEGPWAPLVGRFVLAGALGPVLFHGIMAAPLPALVQHGARAMLYLVHPAMMLAANM